MIFHFFTVLFYQMPVFLHLMTVWEGISFSFPKGKQRREVKQMPYYAWKARNGEGRVRKGILAAGCLREAGKELEARFPHILQLRPVSPFQRLFLGRQKLTDLDRETFFRKLGLLLQGGLPILRALRALEGHGSPGLRAFCRELERGLQRGMSLSQVLARQKKQAGLLAASLAEAGENSGQLPFVFQQLALFYQKKRENQKTVLQACLYPALVLCLALAMGACFCWWLVPLFGELYASLGLQPGRGFLVLLACQDFFQSHLLLFLLGVLALGSLPVFLWKERERWLPSCPLVSRLLRSFWEIRFLRLLALLLRGGLPLDQALPQASGILPAGIFRLQAARLERAVIAGSSLSAIARETPFLFSPLAVEFMALGEESGQLPALLTEAAHILDQDFQSWLKNARTLLEPALLVLLAGGCASLMALLLSPLCDLLQGLPLLT